MITYNPQEAITTKADKIVPSAPGNIATLNSDGNLADSGVAPNDLATASALQTTQTLASQAMDQANAAKSEADSLSGQIDTLNDAKLDKSAITNGGVPTTDTVWCSSYVNGQLTTINTELVGHAGTINSLFDGTGAPSVAGITVGASGMTCLGGFIYRYQTADPWGNGLIVQKRGQTGDINGAVKNNSEVGYHSFYSWDGGGYGRNAFVAVTATEDQASGHHGGKYSIATTAPGAADSTTRVTFDENGQNLAGALTLTTSSGTPLDIRTGSGVSMFRVDSSGNMRCRGIATGTPWLPGVGYGLGDGDILCGGSFSYAGAGEHLIASASAGGSIAYALWDGTATQYCARFVVDGLGRMCISAPGTAPNDATLKAGEISWYLDQAAGSLIARVRYADGSYGTASLPVTLD